MAGGGTHRRPGHGARDRLRTVAGRLAAVDEAGYAAVAAAAVPALDGPLRRLSGAASYSRIWLAIAAGLALADGRSGRRAAIRGTLALGGCSALVNLGLKPVAARRRPDRDRAQVPGRRQVAMPASASFPSGHSASGFAFAAALGRDRPRLAAAVRALAVAVAYSRVHTGVHYPGDALAGALIGAAAGRAVARLTDRHAVRGRGDPGRGGGTQGPGRGDGRPGGGAGRPG